MPTYEYKCTECNYQFEEFQSISDQPITVCPECKGKTERIISGGAGFLFKGSGFYITDYRSDKYKAEAKKEDKSTSITTSKDSTTKKDSKKPSADPKS